MRQKSILAMLLAGVMAVGCLSGCGQEDDTVKEQTSSAANEETASVESTTVPETEEDIHPITTEPITFTLLAPCHSHNTNVKGEDYWFFNWLEYRMAELSYDVTIDVTIDQNMGEKMTMMLATNELPDIIWGYGLSTSSTVTYGATDGIILDWTEYMDEYMPNMKEFFEQYPDALVASTCTDGGIYGLPFAKDRTSAGIMGDVPNDATVHINQKWLDECNLEMPTTIEELIDVLRTFKSEIKLESGEEVIPCVSVLGASRLEGYIWSCLGYYGGSVSRVGCNAAIKDGKIYLPAYTDDYDTFVDIFHTLYSEGLISQDYYTMDTTTSRGLYTSGVTGMFSDYVFSADLANFEEFVGLPPVAIGDNDTAVASLASTYTINKIWAPANTEYPEVLAILMDQVYSLEGRLMCYYGPMKGTDPLNQLDGWYLDENGAITCDLVEDGTYETIHYYTQGNIYPCDTTVPMGGVDAYARELAGYDKEIEIITKKDVVTGNDIEVRYDPTYTKDNPNGYGRLAAAEVWKDNLTAVKLPGVFRSEEEALRLSELSSVIDDYITAETAKFITGIRPLDEIPDFKEELKALGVEEYIELFETGYAPYMEATFGN